MASDLIYDVGMHNGDDTHFYLSQGFRVVAIEADPRLAEEATQRFRTELRAERLRILNVGIAESSGMGEFWICDECSIWSSFDKRIPARNGSRYHSVMVPTRRFGEILDEHGTPFYLKIDIEGYDQICVKDLIGRPLPPFISVESECVGEDQDLSDSEALATLELLHQVGYRKFKLISQADFSAEPMADVIVVMRRLVRSAAYGKLRALRVALLARALTTESRLRRKHRYDFRAGSSGPWGEDADGRWMTFELAARLYLKARRRHFKYFQKWGHVKYSFWCDWHARY